MTEIFFDSFVKTCNKTMCYLLPTCMCAGVCVVCVCLRFSLFVSFFHSSYLSTYTVYQCESLEINIWLLRLIQIVMLLLLCMSKLPHTKHTAMTGGCTVTILSQFSKVQAAQLTKNIQSTLVIHKHYTSWILDNVLVSSHLKFNTQQFWQLSFTPSWKAVTRNSIHI